MCIEVFRHGKACALTAKVNRDKVEDIDEETLSERSFDSLERSSGSSLLKRNRAKEGASRLVGCLTGFLAVLTLHAMFRVDFRYLSGSSRTEWYCPSCRANGRPELVPDYHAFNFEKESKFAPMCSPLQAPSEVDFTLVTQLSVDRAWILGEHCKRWGAHPMSIAFGGNVTQADAVALVEDMACDLRYMTIAVVRDYEDAAAFPVNKLRNLALQGVQTSHAVVIDADFLLSNHLYEHLKVQHERALLDAKHALVIPAFELRKQCDPGQPGCRELHLAMLPQSKLELTSLLVGDLDEFVEPLVGVFDGTFNFHGHGSTRYAEWTEQAEDELLPISCLTSPRYEPYLVIRYCRDLPPFQEAFTGYGKNKITWMRQLVRSGWHFSQISGGYAIHFPHTASSANRIWSETRKLDIVPEADRISASFDLWLAESVRNETKVPRCPKVHQP